MGYGMKALRATGRLINELAREEERRLKQEIKAKEKAYKEKIKAEKQAIKLQKELEKLKQKTRKEKAKYYEYIFENDEVSKLENQQRVKGILKDYAFWQFFALEDDIKEANAEIQQYVKEIELEQFGKAEWRVEK